MKIFTLIIFFSLSLLQMFAQTSGSGFLDINSSFIEGFINQQNISDYRVSSNKNLILDIKSEKEKIRILNPYYLIEEEFTTLEIEMSYKKIACSAAIGSEKYFFISRDNDRIFGTYLDFNNGKSYTVLGDVNKKEFIWYPDTYTNGGSTCAYSVDNNFCDNPPGEFYECESDCNVDVDILVLYSSAALNYINLNSTLNIYLDKLEADFKYVFENNGIGVRLNFCSHPYEWMSISATNCFVNAQSIAEDPLAQELRNAFEADLVIALIDPFQDQFAAYGCAALQSSNQIDDEYSYCIVQANRVFEGFETLHEVGHLFGANHGFSSGFQTCCGLDYDFDVDQATYSTILNQVGRKIPFYSDPFSEFNGVSCGEVLTNRSTNNAGRIRTTACEISNYRDELGLGYDLSIEPSNCSLLLSSGLSNPNNILIETEWYVHLPGYTSPIYLGTDDQLLIDDPLPDPCQDYKIEFRVLRNGITIKSIKKIVKGGICLDNVWCSDEDEILNLSNSLLSVKRKNISTVIGGVDAVWNYNYYGAFSKGVTTVSFEQDTLIDNHIFQKYISTAKWTPWSNLYDTISIDLGTIFLHNDAFNRVFYKVNDSCVDTLFDFNLSIGDIYYLADPFSVEDTMKVTVLESSSDLFLQVLKYEIFGGVLLDTIYNYIGSVDNYINPFDFLYINRDQGEGGKLICFSSVDFDTFIYLDEFIFFNGDYGECEIEEETTSVNEPNYIAREYFTISPNPSKGYFLIDILLEKEFFGEVQVYNFNGRKVYDQDVHLIRGRNLIQIDLTYVSKGVYFFKIGSVLRKIIIL